MMKLLAVFLLVFSMVALTSGVSQDNLLQGSCCPSGWTPINGRCFLYVASEMSWAKAEKNCLSLGANLASIHNVNEYHQVQALITAASRGSGQTWIGASDAEQERTWLWSDGSPMIYTNWCRGQPDNWKGNQNCVVMNYQDNKCWDDHTCDVSLPSVCARTV
ncbi:ladderlectin-like isoform X1 [Poecilia formosa]|uniref:ladderlectin-like isoform X1 n=2 Tax=Poecilia formosa TaxID=48698 RepID=UPI0007BA56B1|nr:PREDICTED: ladderlectin-like isoform X1 [Poecilia formosa]XP_016522019.1 PREDICTED: ladderlectin-like isoform X1 [Poecilia formosa]